MRRALVVLVVIASLLTGAWAPAFDPATMHGALPVSAESELALASPCIGKLIDGSPGPKVLMTLSHFDDGTVPVGQNGPLNDRGYLLGLAAVSNLRSKKLMATVEGPDQTRAILALKDQPQTVMVTLNGSFTAYDQHTQDRSKSLDIFLFAVQGTAARDLSYSALQFTGVLMANGMPLAGGAFRHKAVLQNLGSRYNISLFTDNSDIGATLAKSSFQAIGDLEALLVDLAVVTAASRIYDIDISPCLNRSGGADYGATTAALFDQLSRREIDDRVIAALFRLGYLRHPTTEYSEAVSRALREFQSRYGQPPDGLPSQPTFLALGRAVQDDAIRPSGVDVVDSQLGAALEVGRTGSTVTWSRGGMTGYVTIGQTWTDYLRQGRPCRAFTHVVETEGRRLAQPEKIACRLDAKVWAAIT